MDVIYVLPDYYSQYPKPLYGRVGKAAAHRGAERRCPPLPAAHALPLPRASADQLAGLDLGGIAALPAFSGDGLDADPCRSCDRRELDFGGCRCQAFQLTGDAARTDPSAICRLTTGSS